MQQALGGVEIAHQGAGGGEAPDELEHQGLDRLGLDRAELGHDDRNLAQLVVIEQLPYLLAVLLAEREHQDRGALGPGQGPAGAVLRLAAGQRRDQIGNFVLVFLCGGHGCLLTRGIVEPFADDRDGLVRVAGGELAHLLDRLRVHLALHLGHVDHARGLAGRRLDGRDRFRGCERGARVDAKHSSGGVRAPRSARA